MRGALYSVVMLMLVTGEAAAHGGSRTPHEGPWWTAWDWAQPLVVPNLTILTLLYSVGLFRLWRRVGFGRTISRRQAL